MTSNQVYPGFKNNLVTYSNHGEVIEQIQSNKKETH